MPRRSKPDPLAEKIGLRIRQLRVEAGLSLEKLAYESELGSKGHLSDVERGLTRPTVTTLKVLADRLGVALLDLVTFPDEDERQARIDSGRQDLAPVSGYGDELVQKGNSAGLVVAEPRDAGVLRELGLRIRKERVRAELDEESVAEGAGLKAGTLRRIETGELDPTVGTVERIAAAIGIDFWRLVGREP